MSDSAQASLADLMSGVLNHPDAGVALADPTIMSHMNAAASRLQDVLATTDIIDSQGQKVMRDAGVETIAHPENGVTPAATGTSADVGAAQLSAIAKQAAAAVAAEQAAAADRKAKESAAVAKPDNSLSGILMDIIKHQLISEKPAK